MYVVRAVSIRAVSESIVTVSLDAKWYVTGPIHNRVCKENCTRMTDWINITSVEYVRSRLFRKRAEVVISECEEEYLMITVDTRARVYLSLVP